MKPFLAIIFCSFALFGQNKTVESDLELTEDTLALSTVQPAPRADTSIRPSPIVVGSINQTATAAENKKIRFFGEVSGACVWLNYDQQINIWHFAPRFGFGLFGGIAVNLKKPFRFSVGLRFSQTGNSVNLKDKFWGYNYDPITGDPVDSELVTLNGYFQETQYYLSIPINVDVFINKTPFYIFSGIETGYLLRASSFGEYFLNSEKHSEAENDTKSFYRPINVSLNHGLGYQFKLLKKIPSEVQVVFSWGLFPINEPELWIVNFSTREFSLRYRMIF
jgi:hypothetical protein